MFRRTLLMFAFAVLGASWTAIASAQAPDAPAIKSPQKALSYSDAELRSFTLAALNVQRIKDLYLPKLEAAKTPEQEHEGEGMTVGKYTEIAKQVQQSPEIAKRVQEHARDAGAK